MNGRLSVRHRCVALLRLRRTVLVVTGVAVVAASGGFAHRAAASSAPSRYYTTSLSAASAPSGSTLSETLTLTNKSVIPIGSADGMLWLNAGRVLVRGREVPIVSSPSLEHTRIDLTSVPDAVVGDEVVIIGRQGHLEITQAEVASRHGLGLHHVATTVGPRVARVYLSASPRG